MELIDSIDKIKGVGEKTKALFEKMKVNTVEDLLELYPRNYLTYEAPVDIEQAEVGKRVSIRGVIQSYVEVKQVRSLKIVSCMVKDFTGAMKLTWFNMPFLKQYFHIGQAFIFVGVVSVRGNQKILEHPEYYDEKKYEALMQEMQPVYPLTEGLSNKTVQKSVHHVIPMAEKLTDYLPAVIRNQYNLLSIQETVKEMHFPKNYERLGEAKRRVIFDEFFLFLLAMERMRKHSAKVENHYIMKEQDSIEPFIKELPYKLTEAQIRAINEIIKDMQSEYVMNRLVQGDVGSGKTVVAMAALLLCVKSGYQGAFMAPTEVLATQHYETFQKSLAPYGVRIGLLIGSTPLKEKRKLYEQLKNQELDIMIGTHAIIQDKVEFHNLALVITDEQHRFGVRQRNMLAEKGVEPHVLVMSATPIPRTLAIIMYGDLDISIMNQMPANRLPIKNCVVGTKYRPTAYRFIEKEVLAGHQVYVICPMVEESEAIEAENVISYTDTLRDAISVPAEIAYLHGKMSAAEKAQIMERFYKREIQILVSTTVIEVGIDNPNATVIMIENAQRFGLAQLHQLRGRVGRGDAQSYCIMVSSDESKKAMDRLNVLKESNDGFFIANEDLKLRGPGDFFGVRQSGELLFHYADIYNHADILKMAQEAVSYLKKEDFDLETIEHKKLGTKIQDMMIL